MGSLSAHRHSNSVGVDLIWAIWCCVKKNSWSWPYLQKSKGKLLNCFLRVDGYILMWLCTYAMSCHVKVMSVSPLYQPRHQPILKKKKSRGFTSSSLRPWGPTKDATYAQKGSHNNNRLLGQQCRCSHLTWISSNHYTMSLVNSAGVSP